MSTLTTRSLRLLLTVAAVVLALAGTATAAGLVTDQPAAGRMDAIRYVTQPVTVAPLSSEAHVAACPSGSRAVDGGSTPAAFLRLDASAPTDSTGAGWRVELWNHHPSQPLDTHVWAACLDVA